MPTGRSHHKKQHHDSYSNYSALGATSYALESESRSRHPRPSSPNRNVVDQDQFVKLVIDGLNRFAQQRDSKKKQFVSYVNALLKTKGTSISRVTPRKSTKYGNGVRALDLLCKATAKDISAFEPAAEHYL